MPFCAVSFWPSTGTPFGEGCELGAGADPVFAMTPLGAESACPDPSAFVAVTLVRTVLPTSELVS